jgi:tripartite-type tricarboxylate transporter receptor subunit TctC
VQRQLRLRRSGLLQQRELKILAVTSAERLPSIPDVPTFEELGYPDVTGYSIYRGSYTKAGLPAEHLAVLEELHELISNDPDWIAYLESISKEVDYRPTDEYTACSTVSLISPAVSSSNFRQQPLRRFCRSGNP